MGNIIGIVSDSVMAKDLLNRMSMPQDTFIIPDETALYHTLTPYEHMVMWKEELSSKLSSDDLLGLIETADLETKIDVPIGQVTLTEQRKLLFLKAMLSRSHNLVLYNFFETLNLAEIDIIKPLLIEASTYTTIFLIEYSDIGFDICDWVIRL